MSELGKYARYVPGKSGTGTVISQRGATKNDLEPNPILVVAFILIGFIVILIGLFS